MGTVIYKRCDARTLWVKKTGPFLFEHNFGKYWPILIILLLLQTEINCDNDTIKYATLP